MTLFILFHFANRSHLKELVLIVGRLGRHEHFGVFVAGLRLIEGVCRLHRVRPLFENVVRLAHLYCTLLHLRLLVYIRRAQGLEPLACHVEVGTKEL